jgi:hypothetical protein
MIVEHWDKVENYRTAVNLKDDLVDFILDQLQIDVGPADGTFEIKRSLVFN